MRQQGLSLTALLALTILVSGATARGQGYYYPPGYGGWYGWGGGDTAFGANARGMGIFAAGLGAYNLDTAQAHAISADANMRLNEYLWQSQQIRNKRYYEQLAARRERNTQTTEETYKRIRENPEPRDIQRGDALNAALDEITDPRVYVESLEAAQQSVPSALVKAIPFQYAPWAVTVSLGEIARTGLPETLRDHEAIAAKRQELQEILDRVEAGVEDNSTVSTELLGEAQTAIKALHAAIHGVVPPGPDRRESDNFLKALYGLTRMLETPQFENFLHELDQVEEATLAHLINFMNAFNLRFGVAETEVQQQAYAELYPILDALRDEVNPEGSSPLVERPRGTEGGSPFEDMRFEDFDPQPPLEFQRSAQPVVAPGQPELSPDRAGPTLTPTPAPTREAPTRPLRTENRQPTAPM